MKIIFILLPLLLFAQDYYIDKSSGLFIADKKVQPKLSWNDGKKYCEDLKLGEFSDWYLPTIEQMVSFEDRTNSKTFLKKELKNTHRYDYWSTTEDAMSSEYAWSQGLMYKAYNHIHNKKDKKYIRCVRGEKYKKPYYIKYKNIVVDKINNIAWEDDNNASTLTLNYTDALTYCQDLKLDGYDDWQLPTIKILRSLVDVKKFHPAINSAFKHTANEGYYSSNLYNTNGFTKIKYADVIEFNNGIDGHTSLDEKQYVRCYRKIKSSNKMGTIDVYFTYDNSILYINGKEVAILHSIMDDYQGTSKIKLSTGVHYLEVRRVSDDGQTIISGNRTIYLNSGEDMFVKIIPTIKKILKKK